MDTEFLRTFVVVAETGSMAEAGRRRDLTSASVAHQMRVLERELGTALLRRSGRTVQPTPAGHRLLDRARVVLADVDGLRAVTQGGEIAGELRLGTINTALHTMLPETLGRLARKHPGLTVFIQSGTTQQLYELVRQNFLDAAVCLHPSFELPKTLFWASLREETMVVLAPRRLAGADPLDLLRRQPLLRYDRSLGGGKQADAFLRAHGIEPHERFELSSLLAIALMVDQGLGVSLVPDIGSPLTAGLAIAKLALPAPATRRSFGMLWPRASPRVRLAEALLRQARQTLRRAGS